LTETWTGDPAWPAMDDPAAGVMLSQLGVAAPAVEIVCGWAVQLSEPVPWLEMVNGCEGGGCPPATAENVSPDCESVIDWVAWVTAIVTSMTACAVEFASCTVIWPV